MKICLLGDFSGTPDEGMKNISKTIKDILSLSHNVLSINSRDVIKLDVLSEIRKFSPEIMHYLHGPTIRSLMILKGLELLLMNNTSTVISATRPYFSKYSMWSIPFFKPSIILTQSLKYETFFKDKGCNTSFIPNGVNCEKFSPVTEDEKNHLRQELGLPNDKKIILHVGHIKPNRKLEIFIKIQQTNDFQVVIVGGTSQKSDEILKNNLVNSGIRIFHEYFDDISIIYKSADFYVFPISDVGIEHPTAYNQIGAIDLPLSVLEAMACNLPVITTNFGALERLFEPGDGLYYCKDETTIVDFIKKIPDESTCNTREKVLPYDWESITNRILNVYKNILG